MKKFALVVGASGAIGSAICVRLAQDGWSLYMHYAQHAEKVATQASEFTKRYPDQEFMTVQADFKQLDGAERLAKQLFTVQTVIFAQGQSHEQLLEDTSMQQMDELWRVHVQNPMQLISLIASKLRQHTTSYLLMIGSIWGEAGAAGEVVYSAVKGAQHSFVKAYAQEVAYNGIRVNAIAPGFIDTVMNHHLDAEEREAIQQDIPLQQFGQPHDIANMTAFYVSGQADYVTGQIIRINGGWYI